MLLREALGLFAVDGYLVRRSHVRIEKAGVVATVIGERADFARHAVYREIKAVTAHALAVRKTKEGLLARYVVDV